MLKSHNKDILMAWLTAMFVYLVTAIFSVGYHHFTEYVNVIDVVLDRFRSDTQSAEILSDAEGRIPGLQPMLSYAALSFLNKLGVTGPFEQMLLLRIFMGFFCLAVFYLLLREFLSEIFEERLIQPMIYLTPLLWFSPYICVRFSQDVFSAALFFLGMSLILIRRADQKRSFLTKVPTVLMGLALGLAFSVKYLTGIMIVGALLWLIIYGKLKLKTWLWLIAGLLLGCGAGILADRWLYGYWTWSLLPSVTLFFSDMDAGYWWQWFTEIFFNGGFIVGLCVLFCMFYFWVRNLKHWVSWISIPLFLVSILFPASELYHLFPLVFVITFMMIHSTQDLIAGARKKMREQARRALYYSITFVFLVANCAFLCLFAFKDADPDTGTIYFIEKQYRSREVILLYADQSNPFEYPGLQQRKKMFYIPEGLEMYHVSKPDEVKAFLQRRDKMVMLCVRKKTLDAGFSIDRRQWVRVYESLPDIYFSVTADFWEPEADKLEIWQPKTCRLLF
jgi:hypothetical protein